MYLVQVCSYTVAAIEDTLVVSVETNTVYKFNRCNVLDNVRKLCNTFFMDTCETAVEKLVNNSAVTYKIK